MPDQPALLQAPELYTDTNGYARFRELKIALQAESPQVWLSSLVASAGSQFRMSPVGFASDFHCTGTPQWLVVLQGCMEIALRDGSTRRFGPGEFFHSNDTLPPGERFDPARHGHRSRQAGEQALVTLFVRTGDSGMRAP